jgi:hypothetical protein
MPKDAGRRLKVWRWDGRDAVSLHDLEFVTAVPARSELQTLSARLRLPKPGFGEYVLVKPTDERFDVAMAAPGRVFWRDLEGGGLEWQVEEALQELRASSTARTQYGTPLHRS